MQQTKAVGFGASFISMNIACFERRFCPFLQVHWYRRWSGDRIKHRSLPRRRLDRPTEPLHSGIPGISYGGPTRLGTGGEPPSVDDWGGSSFVPARWVRPIPGPE